MMLSTETQMMIYAKIKKINKMTNGDKQLDEFIFTKQKVQETINDELDDIFSRVILVQKKADEKKALDKKLKQMTFCFDEEAQNLIDKEALFQYIEESIDGLYWYDQEIIKLYLKLGSYRAIQKETGIPWISCYKVIKRAFDGIKSRTPKDIKPIVVSSESINAIGNAEANGIITKSYKTA